MQLQKKEAFLLLLLFFPQDAHNHFLNVRMKIHISQYFNSSAKTWLNSRDCDNNPKLLQACSTRKLKDL